MKLLWKAIVISLAFAFSGELLLLFLIPNILGFLGLPGYYFFCFPHLLIQSLTTIFDFSGEYPFWSFFIKRVAINSVTWFFLIFFIVSTAKKLAVISQNRHIPPEA